VGEDKLQKITSPEGEEFYVEVEATNRILNEGLSFIIVDIREKRLSIKEGDYFLFTNQEGSIPSDNTSGLGFYYQDTRFLSCFEFTINGRHPILLSSTAERNYLLHVELTNADIRDGERLIIPQETLNMRRLSVIADGLYERIRVKNYNSFAIELDLAFAFAADFADIFEVRGLRRKSRGKLLYPKLVNKDLVLAYMGEDGVFRRTEILLPEKPDLVETIFNKTVLHYKVKIKPGQRIVLNFYIKPHTGRAEKAKPNFNAAITTLRQSYTDWEKECSKIYTDNELFNSVLNRGASDIRALLTNIAYGSTFHAGIPWYVAPFGRDSLITAIQVLPLNTHPARDTLKLLAVLQGKEVNEWRDEEPGKILHELRRGELANLEEIPHTPYYGSVDSTPLFLILVAEYYRWTRDKEFIKELRKTIEGCLEWIDKYGDKDGDLFIEYERKSKRGLINQGWKDSWNSVAHTDGNFAEPPIALSEVQGYVYMAKKEISEVFQDLGETRKAKRLKREAEELKKKFNQEFWMEEEGFFAMALDGSKNQVKTITSNPGHCLWTGIVEEEKAKQVVRRLMRPDMFSGWGIRTVSKGAKIYNPMSYHNGSVWPHDNSIIIAGIKRYGFDAEATTLASALFDAAIHHAYYRLPELFCGFTRRGANWPVSYPVACSPMAWSAGSIFLILQAMLGITPQAQLSLLKIVRPVLPKWLNHVEWANLSVGDGQATIIFRRDGNTTTISESKRVGQLRILLEE
jgi:glycogen debranching enzyme